MLKAVKRGLVINPYNSIEARAEFKNDHEKNRMSCFLLIAIGTF
jgi:hypothetical protein